jgi:hypothetical protein
MNEAIPKDYAVKSKNKVGSVALNLYQKVNSSFFGISIMSGAIGKGGNLLFEMEADRQKGVFFILCHQLILVHTRH